MVGADLSLSLPLPRYVFVWLLLCWISVSTLRLRSMGVIASICIYLHRFICNGCRWYGEAITTNDVFVRKEIVRKACHQFFIIATSNERIQTEDWLQHTTLYNEDSKEIRWKWVVRTCRFHIRWMGLHATWLITETRSRASQRFKLRKTERERIRKYWPDRECSDYS